MTAAFDFYAERAFLGFVKRTIDSESNPNFSIDDGAISILACAAALEGLANRMLEFIGRLKKEKDSTIRNKIVYLATVANIPSDWDIQPWSGIHELLSARNWLAHYKDSEGGLISHEGKWIKYSNKNFQSLSRAKLEEYYQ